MGNRLRLGSTTEEERLDALIAAAERPTDLIGRQSDLIAVASRLRPGRLVTVSGPGGVGKTALADTVADFVSDLFDDGWRCDLVPAHDRSALESIIADAIGTFRNEDATVFEAIVEALRGRHALLVLDNAEQVVGAAASVVSALLERCPGLTVLATSRVALGLESEDVWVLSPLSPQTDAAELFARLAARRIDRAELEAPGMGQAIIDICRDLDGVPLALELAAAQLPELSLAQIRDRLDQRFRVLRDRERSDRQSTLVAAVRWSYDLLQPIDRNLFDRLSVFQGGFDLAGATAVLGPDAARHDVPAIVERLVAASMLSRRVEAGSPRYSVLETLRQFGDRQLAERGERASARNAHLDHTVAVAAAAAARCHGPEWRAGVADFLADWGNLRSAVQWAIDTQRHADVDRMLRDVFFMSRWTLEAEPAEWARRALDRASVTDAPVGAPVHLHCGFAHFLAGDHEEALAANERALTVSATPTDRSWARLYSAIELLYLGRTNDAASVADAMVADTPPHAVEQAMQGSARAVFKLFAGQMEYHEAIAITDRMRELAESSGSPVALGHVGYNIAMLRYARGEVDEATSEFDRALELAREHDIPNLVGYVLLSQVYAPGRPGLLAALDAIRWWQERRDVGNEFVVLEGVGINLAELGRFEPAAVILGHLDQGGRRMASSLQRREAAAADISFNRRANRWSKRGREMSRAELIDYTQAVLETVIALL